MSRLLSEILAAQEPQFSHALRILEEKSGRASHDVRLISDIKIAQKQAITDLGLDHQDTTGKELYYALRHRAIDTNAQLEAHLEITNKTTPQEVAHKIIDFVDSLQVHRDVWTVKHAVIKDMLKKQAPKKVMKILGLRSIDSVLKRMSAFELLALAYRVETQEWTAKFHTTFKKLTPTDFQTSTSCIFLVDQKRIEKLHKGGYHASNIVVPTYETASVLVLPPKNRFPLDSLALTLSLLETLYLFRVYGAYFRHQSVTAHFGARLYDAITNGLPGSIRHSQIGWRALQRHFAANPDDFSPIEQPHLQHEDMQASHPVDVLQENIPLIEFWRDRDYVFVFDSNQPVSLNIMDVIVNASNQLPYEKSIYPYLRLHLWDELGLRYAQHKSVQDLILEFIDTKGANS